MKFDYRLYYRNLFFVPCMVCIALLVFLVVIDEGLSRHIHESSHLAYYVFSSIITSVMFVVVLVSSRQGFYLIKEKESDAVEVTGIVTDTRVVVGSFRYYLDGKVYRADWLVVDEKKYYIISAHDIRLGELVRLKYLPRSRIVLQYEKEKEDGTGKTMEF